MLLIIILCVSALHKITPGCRCSSDTECLACSNISTIESDVCANSSTYCVLTVCTTFNNNNYIIWRNNNNIPVWSMQYSEICMPLVVAMKPTFYGNCNWLLFLTGSLYRQVATFRSATFPPAT